MTYNFKYHSYIYINEYISGWGLVEDPPCIKEINFVADYKPPRPPTPSANGQPRRRDPEEIERELRQQEAELQKLVLIEFRYTYS